MSILVQPEPIKKPKYIQTELGKEKYCPKCDEYFPSSKEFFFGISKENNRLESCCKVCYMERKRSYKGAEGTWGLSYLFSKKQAALQGTQNESAQN